MTMRRTKVRTSGRVRASSPVTPSDNHHHPHTVQFYAADAILLHDVTHFLGTALEAGSAALVVATGARRDALALRLQARGLDLADATARGRFVAVDAAHVLSQVMRDDGPDPERFREVVGGMVAHALDASVSATPGLAVFGEMVALLWAGGKFDAAIQLERLWNELRQTHAFSLRCAYPMGNFDREEHGQAFLQICSEHTGVIPGEGYAPSSNEEERLRVIARLQQRAQALEREVAARRSVEAALKRREAELADLLDNALEGAQRTGPDQKILWANRAVLELLGYSAAEYVGHPMNEFFVHRYAFDEFWAKLMRREEVHDFPAFLRCKSGRVVAVTFQSNGLWENDTFVHTRTFIHDVTARKEMEAAIRRAHTDLEQRVRERTAELHKKNEHIVKQAEMLDMTNRGLRALSTRLLRVQDEERRRIARDLHDSTGQALALLSMNLSTLEAEAAKSSPDLAKGLGENATLVQQISAELRTLSYLLHPPLLEEMGLESALRWYIDGFGQRSNITVTLELPADFQRLPRDIEIATFRIVQECLTNIHRHSGSPTAAIQLSQGPAELTLEVKDEGNGIPPDMLTRLAGAGEAGVGLRGMRERVKDFGGDLNIESSAKGTVVRVTVPVTARGEESTAPNNGTT